MDNKDLLGQWRRAVASLRDPVKRFERRRRRARRSLVVRALVALGLAWATSAVGNGIGEVFFGALTCCAVFGVAVAARRVWKVERSPRPVRPTPPPPLPPAGSAARQPMERLASREGALRDLLALLGSAAGDAALDAAAAAATLREHAARIVAVEAARSGTPDDAAAGLDSALAALRLRLDEGVSAYDRLVSAAANAVAAATSGTTGGVVAGALYRLEDASDTLLGLARGMREVAGTDPQASASGA